MAPAPLTPAVFHILLALAEGPLHGYAIMQSVEESSGTAMGPGTIYGTLERDRSAPQRFSALVISGFGIVALLLAAIGLYGVLAFSVSQRRREIAVRLALGAQPRRVLRRTVREGMTLVAIGLAVGAAGAISATRLLRATLFETNVYDPLTFATIPLVLGVVALAASYLPARRAAAIDPIIALRD